MSILQWFHEATCFLGTPSRLSYYPFATSIILLITIIIIAKIFNPIPFLFLGHFQLCTKKLKRKLKVQSKARVTSDLNSFKTSAATTDAMFECHDSSDNLVQKSYCTSRGLTLFLLRRNLLSFFVWAAFFLFSGSDCRNNFRFFHNTLQQPL